MKTNTIIKFAMTFFAYLIASAVVLSHTHAADVVRHGVSTLPSATAKANAPDTQAKVSTDTPTKVGGDAHTHIDKVMIKNIMKTANDTTAARRNELEKSEIAGEDSLLDRFLNGLLMMRVMVTLPVSVQFA